MKRSKILLALMMGALVALSAWNIASAQGTKGAEQPYLGLRMEDTAAGAIVREVIAESPAFTAGFKVDDTLQKIDKTAVANVAEASRAISALKVGDKVTFEINRAGKAQELTATLGSVTANAFANLPSTTPFDAFGYSTVDKAWHVFALAERSTFDVAGVRLGDSITQWDGKAYEPADLKTFRDKLADKDMVTLTVKHGDKTSDVKISAADVKNLDLFRYDNQGLLFDILPVNSTVKSIARDLVTNAAFDAFGYISTDKSWLVYALEEGSPLNIAGLQIGDKVTKFDGKTYDPAGFHDFRAKLADDASLTLTVDRNGKSVDVKVQGVDLNVLHLFDATSGAMLFGEATSPMSVWLGTDMRSLNPDIALLHSLITNTGVIIDGVVPDSPAAKAGLLPNDVINAVGKDKVLTPFMLQKLLDAHKPGDQITLDVLRNGKTMQISATLAAPEISGEIPPLVTAQ